MRSVGRKYARAVAAALSLLGAAGATPAAAQNPAAPGPGPAGVPEPVVAEPPRRFGDQGTSRAGLALSLGFGGGGMRYAAGADYGYFVVQQVAPGAEALVSGGSDLLTTGMVMANIHVIPLRTRSFAIPLAARGGRVLISDHDDGWGAGGSGGVIFFAGSRVGVQITYQYLRLFPAAFCRDLLPDGCDVQGLQLGIVAGF